MTGFPTGHVGFEIALWFLDNLGHEVPEIGQDIVDAVGVA